MSVVIRTWREGDDAELVKLWAPLSGWTDASLYARKFEDPGNAPERVFVAELDGKIVGHALASRRQVFAEGEWRGFGGVGHLIVHPTAKGLGIGRKLLAACDDAAERAGMRAVLMWTKNTYHPAYQMYLRDRYELLAQGVHHEVDLEWVADRLGPSPLCVRPLGAEDRAQAAAIREQWAHEAFPVSTGWEVGIYCPPALGYFEGEALVGISSNGRADPILPGRDVREAMAALAEYRLAQGERASTFTVTANAAADRALTSVSHNRELSPWCTILKHFGPPIDMVGQEPVHGGVWSW